MKTYEVEFRIDRPGKSDVPIKSASGVLEITVDAESEDEAQAHATDYIRFALTCSSVEEPS